MRVRSLLGLALSGCASSPSQPAAVSAAHSSITPETRATQQNTQPSAPLATVVAPPVAERALPAPCEGADIDLTAAFEATESVLGVKCGIKLDKAIDTFTWPESLRPTITFDKETVRSKEVVRVDVVFTNSAAHSITLTLPYFHRPGAPTTGWGPPVNPLPKGTPYFVIEALDAKGVSTNAAEVGIGAKSSGFLDTEVSTDVAIQVRIAPGGKARAVGYWRALVFKKMPSMGQSSFLQAAPASSGMY